MKLAVVEPFLQQWTQGCFLTAFCNRPEVILPSLVGTCTGCRYDSFFVDDAAIEIKMKNNNNVRIDNKYLVIY